MHRFSLQELACLEAVASEGSFQAAAARLNRTHPAVHAALRSLEAAVGVPLLDRSAYRVALTDAGRSFLARAKVVLAEAQALQTHARHLAHGDEPDLHVVVGDLCPAKPVLRQLKRFFESCGQTRLHLHFESLAGPWERLYAGEADLILHHVDQSDARLEWAHLFEATLVPVVAPGLLALEPGRQVTPRQMKAHVQCVIRDSARQPQRDYFLLDGARSCTVPDQETKKELILQGLGWGHMPLHMVERELQRGRLLSIEGRHFKRTRIDIVAARLRSRPPGPVAQRLWSFLHDVAAQSSLFDHGAPRRQAAS